MENFPFSNVSMSSSSAIPADAPQLSHPPYVVNESPITSSYFSSGGSTISIMLKSMHRNLQEGATNYYEDNRGWINGLAIAFGV